MIILEKKFCLEKINLIFYTTKKESGIITTTFFSVLLIFMTFSFLLYMYYGFQKFYIKRIVKNCINDNIRSKVLYNYKEEKWWFEVDENNIIDIESGNEFQEIEMYLSDSIKAKFIKNFNQEDENNILRSGIIKILGDQEKYNIYGTSYYKGQVNIEAQNQIETKFKVEKTDYLIDENGHEFIEKDIYSNKNQILDSTLKIKIKIRIKTTYPLFFFTEGIEGDEFVLKNYDNIKRVYYDIDYIISI